MPWTVTVTDMRNLPCQNPHLNLQETLKGFGEQLWSAEWQAEHNAPLTGRTQNTQQYKPGSQEVLLLFSDREGGQVYQFPLYEQLKHVLEPILLQVTISLEAVAPQNSAMRHFILFPTGGC